MSISEKAVEVAVDRVLRDGVFPIYQTQDDNGLERDEYVQFVSAVLAVLPLHQHAPTDSEPVEAIKRAYAYLNANAVKYGDGPAVYNEHGQMIFDLLDYVQRLRGVIREANIRLRPSSVKNALAAAPPAPVQEGDRIARLRSALGGLHSFVAVMIGRGPDAIIPEVCSSPLGIPIKIGELMREASALIAEKDPQT
jgi:hypothetical protein